MNVTTFQLYGYGKTRTHNGSTAYAHSGWNKWSVRKAGPALSYLLLSSQWGDLLQGWSVPRWEENTLATLQRLPQLRLETDVYVKLSSWVQRMTQVWIRKGKVVEIITLRIMNTKHTERFQLPPISVVVALPVPAVALDSCHSSSPLFYFFLGFWNTTPTWFSGHLTERSLPDSLAGSFPSSHPVVWPQNWVVVFSPSCSLSMSICTHSG